VAWGRILTYDNLMRRGYVMACWCYKFRDDETVDHLSLHYGVDREVWSFVFRYFGVD
jgi:hypothetical protein